MAEVTVYRLRAYRRTGFIEGAGEMTYTNRGFFDTGRRLLIRSLTARCGPLPSQVAYLTIAGSRYLQESGFQSEKGLPRL
ncbi:MAG: hypothetical protein RIS70_3516 [Planctomycetota bacterium]